jgi:AcrR family transcriptional regulator
VRTKTPQLADKILGVAVRLFATHRFHEARMEDIAAAAEVGKGTLYRYFKDKDELYRALLDRAAEQYVARLHDAINGAAGARARLEAFTGEALAFFSEQPYLFDVIQHAEALHKPGDAFPWQRARDESLVLMRRIFDEGKNEGAFVLRDSELALYLLLGGLRAVIRFTERPWPSDVVQRIIEMFLHGAALAVEAPSW